MRAWRLASSRYSPLTGEGARLAGGRWNSPGVALIYASESLALCLAECLVHIPTGLPRDYHAIRLEVPDGASEWLDPARLPAGWESDIGYTRAIGDEWCRQGRSLALRVPSAVLPESTNVLLNPAHPLIERVGVTIQPFTFDPRLRPGLLSRRAPPRATR
jgi:RES domain-containing protein